MYQQFFQFRRLPFQPTPDPHFFFFTTRHEEAFNQALYTVRERKGFMVLTGEVGTGKTTLSRLLIEQLGPRVKSALIFNPNLTTVELLQSINHDFGVGDQSYSKKILTDGLNQFLLEQLMQGGNAVLIVDEAQTLSVECLEEIRLLSNLETPRAKLLQILLVGQPELLDKLELPQLRQLNQRIVVRARLTSLEPQEVADYIQYRLWRAGGREAVHFEPAALELVYRYSGGVPRLVNALCDRALLAAYVRGTRRISGYLMSQAVGELTPILPVTEPPPPYLTQEAPVPSAQRRSDPMLRVAVIGLASLLVGLGVMWWKAASFEQRFPTALMAHEQSDDVPSQPPLPLSGNDLLLNPPPPPSPAQLPAQTPIQTPQVIDLFPPDAGVEDPWMRQPLPGQEPPPGRESPPSGLPPAPAPAATERSSPALPQPSAPSPAPVSRSEPAVPMDAPARSLSPLTAMIRLPLLPTEVMVTAPRAPSSELPKTPDAPVPLRPAAAIPVDRLPVELKADHVRTDEAGSVLADARTVDVRRETALALRAGTVPETMPETTDDRSAAVSPAPQAAWFVDGDDVIRVGKSGSPELMERAALLMLLRQWGAVPDWPPKEPGGVLSLDPEALAGARRLELLQAPLSAQELLKLDYPAIVMRKSGVRGEPPRPVVVSRVVGGRVVLLDPGAGFLSRPAGTIERELTGMVRLYWRPLNGWRWPGPINGEDPVVRWLQRHLRERQIYHGRLDGLVGPDTEQALRQWAAQRGLTVSPADPLIDLFISQLLAPSDFPHLSLPDGGPSRSAGQTGTGPKPETGSTPG